MFWCLLVSLKDWSPHLICITLNVADSTPALRIETKMKSASTSTSIKTKFWSYWYADRHSEYSEIYTAEITEVRSINKSNEKNMKVEWTKRSTYCKEEYERTDVIISYSWLFLQYLPWFVFCCVCIFTPTLYPFPSPSLKQFSVRGAPMADAPHCFCPFPSSPDHLIEHHDGHVNSHLCIYIICTW